jgi:hypothetical protein
VLAAVSGLIDDVVGKAAQPLDFNFDTITGFHEEGGLAE